MSNSGLPFRQVHLDFHTSPDIPGVASDFDPEKFAATLKRSHVQSATCFARCHHGMLYYESKLNPERIHPGLVHKNLLGEQIEACHRAGIRVPVYTTVQWDHYTATSEPGWLALTESGGRFGENSGDSQRPFEPGFYSRLCVNSEYRDFLEAHTREILQLFDVDGLFFDIVSPIDCACPHCISLMRGAGMDASDKEERLRFGRLTIDDFMSEMSALVRSIRPDCSIFYNRGHVGYEHRSSVSSFSHFELESLPSGIWGYMHFPSTARYARGLGLEYMGQTGKFHTMWGDFHSFKNEAALHFETSMMLALGARCSIGDQIEPPGRLSAPVYDLIGRAFEEVERKEPWCVGASPLVDIGVLTPEEFVRGESKVGEMPPSLLGAVRMLQECAHQFDVIDSESDFSRYKLLVLPDTIPTEPTLAQKLDEYLAQGGSLLASFESGMDREGEAFVLTSLGIRATCSQTRDSSGRLVRGRHFPVGDYAEYLLPGDKIGRRLPRVEHVMYMKGVGIEALPGTEVLCDTRLSYFDRTWEHFCSHRQTPSSGRSGGPAATRKWRSIYLSHPIFAQYHRNAPRWCKLIVADAIDELLPEPIVRHSGPSGLVVTVNEQAHKSRAVLHLLFAIPERRGLDLDVIEDLIPLHDIDLSLRLSRAARNVRLAPSGEELAFSESGGRTIFRLPRMLGHQMVEIDYI